MSMIEENIVLQKPLGTDIYDVQVFNANFKIIEEYLNRFYKLTYDGLKVYYYPETAAVINIDAVATGIHVCDNLEYSSMSGNFPLDRRWYFAVLSINDEVDTKTRFQLYFDFCEDANNIYIRSWNIERTSWTPWSILGSGGGTGGGGTGGGDTGTSGLTVQYPKSIFLGSMVSGIYLRDKDTTTVSGDLPSGVSDTTNFQLTCYGIPDGDHIMTEHLVDLDTGNVYMRRKIKNAAGAYFWSDWKQLNCTCTGGGGGEDPDPEDPNPPVTTNDITVKNVEVNADGTDNDNGEYDIISRARLKNVMIAADGVETGDDGSYNSSEESSLTEVDLNN